MTLLLLPPVFIRPLMGTPENDDAGLGGGLRLVSVRPATIGLNGWDLGNDGGPGECDRRRGIDWKVVGVLVATGDSGDVAEVGLAVWCRAEKYVSSSWSLPSLSARWESGLDGKEGDDSGEGVRGLK